MSILGSFGHGPVVSCRESSVDSIYGQQAPSHPGAGASTLVPATTAGCDGNRLSGKEAGSPVWQGGWVEVVLLVTVLFHPTGRLHRRTVVCTYLQCSAPHALQLNFEPRGWWNKLKKPSATLCDVLGEMTYSMHTLGLRPARFNRPVSAVSQWLCQAC